MASVVKLIGLDWLRLSSGEMISLGQTGSAEVQENARKIIDALMTIASEDTVIVSLWGQKAKDK